MTVAQELVRDRAAALSQIAVSRETVERLDAYVALLLKWQTSINLVSPRTLSEIWTRHILDSAQLLGLAPAGAQRWVDLGSGGGLPGLVIAILGADRIGFEMILVESDQRKAAFLRTAAREVGLSRCVSVRAERIEEVTATLAPADVVSARALAPLSALIALSRPLLESGAVGIFPKGETIERELTEWGRPDNFQVTLAPSRTHPAAAIALIHMRPS
jgi:16S rRNA (guanine527-N7)-methyltransferase